MTLHKMTVRQMSFGELTFCSISRFVSAEMSDSDPLVWVWKTEIEIHRRLLSVSRSQLLQLDRCIKGEKVMDRYQPPYEAPGRAIYNGREPRSCLGGVFNIKLGSFVSKQLNCMAHTHSHS
jgi:hypothetical protein